MCSVFGTEKATPIFQPVVAMVEKSLCKRRMFPLWDWEATIIEKSSTYKTMTPQGTDMCCRAMYSRKRRGVIHDAWVVPTEPCERMLGDPGKNRVQVLSGRKEVTQWTM